MIRFILVSAAVIIVGFVVLTAIAACVLSSHISREEERWESEHLEESQED